MSGQIDNPGFISDDGKSNYRVTPALSSADDVSRNGKSSVVELKDLRKSKEATGEYEPYLHRDVEHPTTNAETFLHLLKGSLGTGILSMPLAFYHAGYLLGIICTIVIGGICTYCIHMIIQAEYELCKRRKLPSLTYPATAELALLEGPSCFRKLAPFAVHVINIFLLIYQMGICCVYTVFIAENIKHVADEYMVHKLDIKVWMLIFLLPLILINYIKNLKFLAPFSTVANFITIASFGIILYYLIKADMTFEDRHPTGKLREFPLYFGTVLFALEAIGVIMPLENEMKTPKAFKGSCGVLNIGMISIVFLYVAMGLLGYLAYGANIADTITINLTPEDVLAQVAKVLLAIAIYITHPLQLYVAIDIIWNEYLISRFEKSRYQLFFEYAVRTSLVLVTFALAVAIPKLDLFISLFGAFCLSALGLAFPAIIQTCTFWYTLTGVRGKLIIAKNGCIVVFGIIGLVVGTYTSLEKIVEFFND